MASFAGISNCTNQKTESSAPIEKVTEIKKKEKIVYPNGDRYEGEFKDDKRNGQGTYFYANGNRYEGQFKDGDFNGHGIFFFADGERYEGEYKDDKRNGWGTYFYADGRIEKLLYEDGVLKESYDA